MIGDKSLPVFLQSIKVMTYLVNTGLLLMHVIFIFLFWYMQAGIMFYYNFFSVTVFVFTFWIIKYKRTSLYTLIAYSEVYIFMILGTISLGWEYGFAQYCYAFAVSIMFFDFFLVKKERLSTRTYILVILDIAVYIALRIYTFSHPYIYAFASLRLVHDFYLLNSAATFTFIAVFILIYANNAYHMETELREQASKDALTGLTNRRYMRGAMHDIIHGANETSRIGIVMIDIDFFKKVNDTYGHDAGDVVLKSFSESIVQINAGDMKLTSSRWGGEEFLLLFEDADGADMDVFRAHVVALIEELRHRIEVKTILYMDTKISITMTAGVAFFHKGLRTRDVCMEADKLLYQGKENGRNQVVYM